MSLLGEAPFSKNLEGFYTSKTVITQQTEANVNVSNNFLNVHSSIGQDGLLLLSIDH